MAEYSPKDLLATLEAAQTGERDPRTCEIVNRIVADLFRTIEELNVQPAEFWAAVKWLNQLGAAQQVGLATAGLGFDRLLDILADQADERAGLATGTPRAIEGPLYVANAPLSDYEARLDDGTDVGETLVMDGVVYGADGKPLANAIVDVWHADSKGGYSHFDPTQSEFNLRRRLRTDAQGRYRFRSLVPSGYGVPPGSPTEQILDRLGRHGQRPAHIHFLVTGDGQRPLTTQINIPGDAYLQDDFAFATRDGLIVELDPTDRTDDVASLGVTGKHTRVHFDFHLQPA